jgi:hypothetical protein
LWAVNQLTITGVVPGPLLRFDAVDPSDGSAVRTTVHCGHVRLERNRDFRGIVRADQLEPCAFFVPDSEAYPEPPRVLAVETSLRTIRTMGNPNVVAFGAHDAGVAVVPDPRGTGHSWLQITFQSPASSLEQVEINYRVTIQA